MIHIGLLGSSGRMGQWVQKLLKTEYAHVAKLTAVADREDPLSPLLKADIVIDFASPSAMASLAQAAVSTSVKGLPAFVIGSTGWPNTDRETLNRLAEVTPVLMSSNFSTGVLAITDVLKQSAPLFARLGYRAEITETHHAHKKDSPSGTAIALKNTLQDAGPYEKVPIHSIREGEVIGEHKVVFSGAGDQIIFIHSAKDRSIFARGAIDAAIWLAKRRDQEPTLCGLIGIDEFFESVKNSG